MKNIMRLHEQLSYAKDTLYLVNALEKEIYKELEHFDGNGQEFVEDKILDCMITVFDEYLDNNAIDYVELACHLSNSTAGSWDDDKTITLTLAPNDHFCVDIGPTIDECKEYNSIAYDEYLKELFSNLVARVVGSFLHELQHSLQTLKANNDKPEKIFSYRSYNNKDKQKFYDKVNAGVLDIDYQTSPEEIDAFAVGDISRVISAMKDYDADEKKRYITNCFQTIAELGKKYITDKEAGANTIAIKSRHRYMKKLYKGLKDYLDNHIDK
jgi:hypothetical protein